MFETCSQLTYDGPEYVELAFVALRERIFNGIETYQGSDDWKFLVFKLECLIVLFRLRDFFSLSLVYLVSSIYLAS